MTQPRFAPIELGDEVRPMLHLEPPQPWVAHRPGELARREPAPRRGAGTPGPDQGYALSLVRHFAPQLRLVADEHEEDVLVGAVAVALRRAALFGRAPVSKDIELALGIFGYLDDAPPELVSFRKAHFSGVSHHYWDERSLAAIVTEESLRLSPVAARQALADWPNFFQT